MKLSKFRLLPSFAALALFAVVTQWTMTTSLSAQTEEATVESPDARFNTCRNNRRLAIWEDAKLRGVDFRAMGNEPGWHLEISLDSIRLVADYGELQLHFPTPDPDENQTERRTIYESRSGPHALRIVLDGRRCQDSMADVSYETTVLLELDDRVLEGCGRALH